MANSASRYSVIRVSPTLDTSAYADNDIFFNSTEIPSAVIGNGGASKLVGITILNEDDSAHDIDIIFMQKSTDLGTINEAVGSNSKWTNVLAKGAGVLGVVRVDWSAGTSDFVNNLIYSSSSANPSGKSATLPILLQAEDDSNSVYMAAVSRGGTPTTAADDYEIILHIERL